MNRFENSLDHLMAELERVDLRVRAVVAATRQTVAGDERFRGLFISEEDVDALLRTPAGRPNWNGPSESVAASLADLKTAIATRESASEAAGIELRLARLQRVFGLGDGERDVLMFCLACELDLRYERLYAFLQDDVNQKRPTIDLLLGLLGGAMIERCRMRSLFARSAPLRRHRLLEFVEDASSPRVPLLARPVRVAERVVAFLLDDDAIDESLDEFVHLDHSADGIDNLVIAPDVASELKRVAQAAHDGLVVHLRGVSGIGKREAAAAVCADLGRPLLVVELERIRDSGPATVDALWPSLAREAALQNAVLYLRGWDALLGDAHAKTLALVARRVAALDGLVFIAGNRTWEPSESLRAMRLVGLTLRPLDVEQRVRLWGRELGGHPDRAAVAADVGAKFRFGPVQIRDAAATAGRLGAWRDDAASRAISATKLQALHEACRSHSNQQLLRVARKIVPRYGWDDIVLPPDRMTMLRDICNQIKYRGQVYGDWGFGDKLAMGKGLAVLFAGPSGTGKTMAADIIARDLGLDLYKIDLAAVVSKYIGETEKNLGAIFDEAETSNAILFFDEADALFGKRSAVKDAHDRYANVEVGYLLQRIEAYEGVAILASNFRKNMDDAFVRRLQFTVDFPFPSQVERSRIWRNVWPKELPRDRGIDADDLGRRFEMTGGNIRNIALAAAFLAADDGGRVGFGHVMRATQREYQKMGKLSDERSFVVEAG